MTDLKPFMRDCVEVGLDEAGRGPGFGRLYTAAVIWPKHPPNVPELSLIRDSKTIKSERDMKRAYDFVRKTAVAWEVTYAEEDEVNRDGPLQADMNALHRGLNILIHGGKKIEHILMDGNYFRPYIEPLSDVKVPHTCVVKGDRRYQSIAAASILAKWSRDQYILDLCEEYPELDRRYSIGKNKGYMTQAHRDGIALHGITEFHRKKYKCCAGRPLNPVGTPRKRSAPVVRIRQRQTISVQLRSVGSQT